MSFEGKVLANRYELRQHLADGAMGAVWVAHHLELDVPVAVKLMSVEATRRSDLRARFAREAKAVALLRHPHVIQIIDFRTDEDPPFIVMELLHGIDLLRMLASVKQWPLPEVATLVWQIASGLEAAHAAGLMHRDVKPGNIFLSRTHAGIAAKLLDFGIAKPTTPDADITGANVILGSPLYMSPEQIRAQPLDTRVDLWALAVVAFRLVTGESPFTGRDGPEIAAKILKGARKRIAPPAPRALELERFFDRAFAPHIDARFASARELADAFILVAGVPAPLHTATRTLELLSALAPTAPQRAALPEEDTEGTTMKIAVGTSDLDAPTTLSDDVPFTVDR